METVNQWELNLSVSLDLFLPVADELSVELGHEDAETQAVDVGPWFH